MLLGMIFIMYFAALTMIFAYISFSEFFLILGIIFALAGVFLQNKSIADRIKKYGKDHKTIINLLQIFIAISLLTFFIVEGNIIYYGNRSQYKKADYVIVLGAGLKGNNMSLTLFKRMEKALEYVNTFKDSKIVLSGGQGPGENISEAEAMEKFLLKNGIAKDRIIKEDKSRNTFENFKYSIEKLDEATKNHKSIALITSDFHMFRSIYTAKKFGLSPYSVPARVHPLLAPNYYVREFFGVLKYMIQLNR